MPNKHYEFSVTTNHGISSLVNLSSHISTQIVWVNLIQAAFFVCLFNRVKLTGSCIGTTAIGEDRW